MIRWACALALLGLLGACGIKAPPKPPVRQRAAPEAAAAPPAPEPAPSTEAAP